MPEPRANRTWFTPIALFLALHTGTLIWVLSATSTSLQYLADQIRELKAEISTFRAADARMGVVEVQVKELDRRLRSVEGHP